MSSVIEWDRGAFAAHLAQQQRRAIKARAGHKPKAGGGAEDAAHSVELSFHDAGMSLVSIYRLLEDRFGTYFDAVDFESSIPRNFTLKQKQEHFAFKQPVGQDGYPPHIDVIPKSDQVSFTDIFDWMRLADVEGIISGWLKTVMFASGGNPVMDTIDGITARNAELREKGWGIYADANVGDFPNWYTDAMYGQQQLTGVNPATITVASPEWIAQFLTAANAQSNSDMCALISTADPTTLYVQDCSYFRDAIGVGSTDVLASDDGTRYASAPVSLFQMSPIGRLHPLAIIIDYLGSVENSVTIFNKRLNPTDSGDESQDWPWRYAKMCAQAADWVRHEIYVHLTHTHLVEEAIIVASHRTFPPSHPVFKLLQSHWVKTLSLNAASRTVLVPSVIVPCVGFTDEQVHKLIVDAYKRFDFVGGQVPNDLANRGFPVDNLQQDEMYHNYTYGRNISLMWQTLRKFVQSALELDYDSDEKVASDSDIRLWYQEMQSSTAGCMPTFPTITTLDSLVDAVTMCIHIASPQHTAINYLQQFYMSFIVNRPPSLCTPLPTNLDDLNQYTETDLIAALPTKPERLKEWLLTTHVPAMLSTRVADKQNLPNYAASIAQLNPKLKDPAKVLQDDLDVLTSVFNQNSAELDPDFPRYTVMDPAATAVSILI